MTEMEQAVLDRDTQRIQAMLSANVKTLSTFIHPSLIYCHSSGRRDSKISHLESIESGALRFLENKRVDFQCLQVGDTVMLDGRNELLVVVDGVKKSMSNRFVSTWIVEDGLPKMLSWSSTWLTPPVIHESGNDN